MSRQRHEAAATARKCPLCGGDLRFSHVEYAGRGQQQVVWRCRACGNVERSAPRARDEGEERRPAARAKPAVDEGPPANTVLDADLAKRLLESLRENGDG